jgi:hypothetical protein
MCARFRSRCLIRPASASVFRTGRRTRALKGKSNPFAQLRFALRAQKYQDGGLYAIGVLERHRGRHIGQTLASALYRRYEEAGLTGAEYHPVNDINLASRTLATSLGGEERILYHNFDKVLR